jgi:hypothetical protein
MTYYENLTLLQNATSKTTYAMNSDTDPPWYDLCGFFPLDDLTKPLIDQNTGKPDLHYDQGQPRRSHLSRVPGAGIWQQLGESQFLLHHRAALLVPVPGHRELKFTGDDDVWVFINGTMAVEMPGIHNQGGRNRHSRCIEGHRLRLATATRRRRTPPSI